MYTAVHRSLKVLAAAFVLLAAAGPIARADTAVWSTTLAGPLAGGTTVEVGVSNLGTTPATGLVAVQAVVGGMVVTEYAPVSLLPGQFTVVVVAFGSPVQGVMDVATTTTPTTVPITLGAIVDDNSPF